jgi:hypothetical protein
MRKDEKYISKKRNVPSVITNKEMSICIKASAFDVSISKSLPNQLGKF